VGAFDFLPILLSPLKNALNFFYLVIANAGSFPSPKGFQVQTSRREELFWGGIWENPAKIARNKNRNSL